MFSYCLWFALLTGLCVLFIYALDSYKSKLNTTHDFNIYDDIIFKLFTISNSFSISISLLHNRSCSGVLVPI